MRALTTNKADTLKHRVVGILFYLLVSTSSSLFAQEVSFNRDIRPILSENCYACHGPGVKEPKGDLYLHQPNEAVASDTIHASRLLTRVESSDVDERMPPEETGKHLSAAQVSMLKRWIDSGATYQPHWAFVLPERPVVPQFNQANPIDGFVIQRLQTEGLHPSPKADRRTLVRRLSLDLTGLPPTSSQVKAYLNDHHDQSYEPLIDRLLASEHYGERMAQEWLDAARYSDTTGFAADQARTMWHYRDWVIHAFNSNMPFDQFTIEQLAGDMLEDATPAQRIATGFHRNSMQALGSNPPKEEFRIKGITDRIDTTGRVWLGLTLACAECHDHKYDPISQEEYYQLFAIFNNIPHYGEAFDVHGPRLKVKPENAKNVEGTPEDVAALRSKLYRLLDSAHKARRPLAHWSFDNDVLDHAHDPVTLRPSEKEISFSSDSPDGKGKSMALKKGQFLEVTGEPIFGGDGSIAISSWIKTRSPVADIVSKNDWQAGQRSIVFGIGGEGEPSGSPGRLFAWVSAQATRWEGVEIYGSLPVNDGQWHHVAFVFEPGKEVRLFVDGAVDVDAKITGTIPPRRASNSRRLVIGAGYRKSEQPNSFFFEGQLLDLRFDSKLHWEGNAEIEQIHERLYAADPRHASIPAMDGSMTAQVMTELDEPRETYIHVRGNFENRGKRVSPNVPKVFGVFGPGEKVDRLRFAKWLVDGKNPLVARVTVNRLWQQFIGTGLVRTVEDFGNQGQWPSHPDLLDWLAVELVESGWNVKHIVKLIVSSQTYQQRSHVTEALLAKDFYNRLLARGPRFRLAGEQIRDSLLSISGLLEETVGGPSVYPVQPSHIGEFRDATAGNWITSQGKDRYRRGIYTFKQRMYPYPSLAIFDAPSGEVSCVRRNRSNTPLQALVLLNDPVFFEAALAFGGRILLNSQSKTDADRVAFAFDVALFRLPSDEESKMFLDFVRQQRTRFQRDETLADDVTKERLPIHQSLSKTELATWTMVGSTIFAMDETFTKQ